MPYKDKAKQREAVKLAVEKHRKGITPEGITEQGIGTNNVIPYPPIVYALADPIKRKRLKMLCEALGHRNLQPKLFYGCGDFSISFDIIEDLLEVTRGK